MSKPLRLRKVGSSFLVGRFCPRANTYYMYVEKIDKGLRYKEQFKLTHEAILEIASTSITIGQIHQKRKLRPTIAECL
jgi:hypothetical protein